jgi:hypothetical protein
VVIGAHPVVNKTNTEAKAEAADHRKSKRRKRQ